MSLAKRLGAGLAPKVTEAAPHLTASFVHQALDRAISGVGPLDSAALAAEKQLDHHRGDQGAAVKALIESHVRLAGAQGFLTNLGGLATMPVAIPANIGGLALIQCRLVAAIAHLRGYDLADTRVRNAVLATLLGRATTRRLVAASKLPGSPRQIAVLSQGDQTRAIPEGRIPRAARTPLDRTVGAQVATTLLAEVGGKRFAGFLARRVPVLGGVVGGTSDAWNTRQLAAYARSELTGP